MQESCLASWFGGMVELTGAECAALEHLEKRERNLRRGETLMRENEAADEFFLLKRGTLMSYVLLADGSRQILRLLFRGDLLGCSAITYAHATETVCALSGCVVSPIEVMTKLRK